jgi:aryl-alcohol dehydrogenase-like predicted oxidoreductase
MTLVDLGSRIGLGTAPLGSREEGPLWWGHQDEATAISTIHAALNGGITWIDTAPFYGWGRAEELVGRALSGRGRRDEVAVLTKCGTVQQADGSWAEDGRPAAIRADLDASLVRLRTDHVDVLQLHDPDPSVPVEETVGAMVELIAAGKVREIGLSNHPLDRLVRAQAVAPLTVAQHQWSILHHPPETDAVRRWCATAGVAFLAWSPLASGYLVDGFDPEATAPGDLRRRLPWATGDGARALDAARAEAGAAGRSLWEHALIWAAATAHPIVGARSPAEAQEVSTLSKALAARQQSS